MRQTPTETLRHTETETLRHTEHRDIETHRRQRRTDTQRQRH